jgi:cell wall-associated NlpC family hydrolase
MNLSDIETALKDIRLPYADSRLNIFAVEIVSLDQDALTLRGRVLQEDDKQVLLVGLRQRFPTLRVDAAAVEVARRPSPRLLTVATNLTSLHNGTSFLAELSTQILNGVTVEILWQEGNWGFTRLPDGYLGWTYLPYLTETPVAQPTHLVVEPVALLREAPQATAALVTRILGGTALRVTAASQDWASVDLAGGWCGWLPLGNLRPMTELPHEPGARREQLVADAFRMIGVPYLWGGSSAHGIDCSGLAQLLHRWIGLTLPRDADLQYQAGRPVEPPFEPGDLLFFGEQGEQRSITHVGVSLGGWRIIHSSRRRNGVQVDDVQSVDGLRQSYLCAATFIGPAGS